MGVIDFPHSPNHRPPLLADNFPKTTPKTPGPEDLESFDRRHILRDHHDADFDPDADAEFEGCAGINE